MPHHRNNIGLLRLLFAALVIIGHAPELVDGNAHREPMTQIFHTTTLGTLSVDGFFLLSGFLITRSFEHSSSVWAYLHHRLLRIYPAFILAYVLSAFVLGPLVGPGPASDLPKTWLHMVTLNPPPDYAGQLVGVTYKNLDGAMWTIAYEFRCYVMVAVLGVTGLLKRRGFILGLTVLAVIAWVTLACSPALQDWVASLANRPKISLLVKNGSASVRLTTVFLVGTCFYLYWPQISPHLSGRAALTGAAAASVLLFNAYTAEAGLVVFGAIALFWVGLKANLGPLQAINDSWDISYGVYLYGWPIAIAILYFTSLSNPWLLAAITLALAGAAGAVSWFGLEKWLRPGRWETSAALPA